MNLLFILLFILIIINHFYETLKINWAVFLIVNRGILAPNCFWWQISELFLKDASGIELYNNLKTKYNRKLIPVNILGNPIQLVTDVKIVEQILNQSPFIFGVGKLKYRMFNSFMPYNVGVSEGLAWIHRRKLNDQVLQTGGFHHYLDIFDKYIYNTLQLNHFDNQSMNLPLNYNQFSLVGKQITNLIVFGRQEYCSEVYQIFSEANSLTALISDNYKISENILNSYQNYILTNIENSQPNCLVELARKYSQNKFELMQQIPHWMFPIVGLVNVSFPRLLLILNNHPEKFRKVVREIDQAHQHSNSVSERIIKLKYLRYCVLEVLRLNNPVVTTFRTLLKDYNFGEGYNYKKGDQFLILNNPFLRDSNFYKDPNQFIPERWNKLDLEDSYYSIMFNQGPQKCPGKDLSMFILMSLMYNYCILANFIQNNETDVLKTNTNSHLIETEFLACVRINTNNIPQMINPCNIEFRRPHKL